MTKPVCVIIGVGPKNGASFARRFARDGYAIALLSRSSDYSQTLAIELEDAQTIRCDVSDPASVEAAFSTARELGPIELLVYNAGSGSWGNIEELSVEDFERSWRVNALGTFVAAQQVIPAMKERRRGTIIVVGATASLRGKPFTTAFAPAKAAQRSLAQALARHLGPQGIHVALLIIDGGIEARDEEIPQTLHPDHIAETAAHLHGQHPSAWSFEVDLRPMAENW